jgi:putative YhbY family RNA-binding protein
MSETKTTKPALTPLTPARRRSLRADAHHLNPVVSISQKGLSATVLAEIDLSLKVHELIKVRLYGIDRDDRVALFAEICTTLSCHEVQHIGNLLVLWRQKPVTPKPADELVPTTRRPKSTSTVKGTGKAKTAPTKRQAMAAEGRNAAGRPLKSVLNKKNAAR